MTLRPILVLGAALAALAAPVGAKRDLASPGSALRRAEPQANWSTAIKRTERGHLVGNPAAEARLIEFVSYTCSHCAHFAMEGDPAIDMTLVVPGKLAVEVRPVIRNALDLTIALLVQCGDPSGFKERHKAFMYGQSEWLAKALNAPQSQQAVWARADKASRMNAASALGLAEMLVQRGQPRTEVNACIMDDEAAKRLIENGKADFAEFGINATPSFALDGKRLDKVHGWDTLYPVLAARFAGMARARQPAVR
jgi:protein-disulfide isomerase